MKTIFPVFAVAIGLTMLVTGCETDGLAARKQEKSAVYATLKPWQKNYIDKSVIALGFTPDMVYIAVGHPTKVEPVVNPDGTKAELWTYKNYFPTVEANALKYTYTTESVYQPSRFQSNGAGGRPHHPGLGASLVFHGLRIRGQAAKARAAMRIEYR